MNQVLLQPTQQISVLHVHSGNLFGGIETVILTCVENLGFAPLLHFEFALCFEGKLTTRLKQKGQTVHRLSEVRSRNPLSILSARRELSDLLKSNRYHAVICHSPWSHAIFAPVFRRFRLPELFWAHDHFSGRHWLERWARRTRPDFVISDSHYSDGSLSRIFPKVPHEVIYYPVNVNAPAFTSKDRMRLRSELQTPEDAIVIVQVGRMEAWKGHQQLLEAASKLSRQENWTIWVVGGAQRTREAQYLDHLKTRAQQLLIANRVRFTGERNDVPQLMAAADVFCQPNAVPEPFGVVFVEALSAGLPVLTFAMGGPAEIVDETCGILVPPGDVSALAAELQRLVSNIDLRRKLSAGGAARARKLCDPAHILPQLERAIVEMARNRAPVVPTP